MIKNDRSETIVIKNPSDKVIGFFQKIRAEKAKIKEEILKKEKYTFIVQM